MLTVAPSSSSSSSNTNRLGQRLQYAQQGNPTFSLQLSPSDPFRAYAHGENFALRSVEDGAAQWRAYGAQPARAAPAPQPQKGAFSCLSDRKLLCMLVVVQTLIAIALIASIAAVAFLSSSASSTMEVYYAAAEPYLVDARDHGMAMLGNAENATASLASAAQNAGNMLSSEYVEDVQRLSVDMLQNIDNGTLSIASALRSTELLASTAAPDLLSSINRTVAMISGVQKLLARPRIQLSLT